MLPQGHLQRHLNIIGGRWFYVLDKIWHRNSKMPAESDLFFTMLWLRTTQCNLNGKMVTRVFTSTIIQTWVDNRRTSLDDEAAFPYNVYLFKMDVISIHYKELSFVKMSYNIYKVLNVKWRVVCLASVMVSHRTCDWWVTHW